MSNEATLSILADRGSRPSIGRRVVWSGLAVLSSVVALALSPNSSAPTTMASSTEVYSKGAMVEVSA